MLEGASGVVLKDADACGRHDGRVPAQAIIAVLSVNFGAAAVTAVPVAAAIVVLIVAVTIPFRREGLAIARTSLLGF